MVKILAALLQALVLVVLIGRDATATPMTSSLPSHEPISTNKRVLVLLDEPSLKNASLKFFDSLTSAGYKLKYKKVSEGSTVLLKTNGEFDYDHVIVLSADKASSASERTVHNFLDFIDNGGNVMIASASSAKWLKDIAFESGVKFGDSTIMDGFAPSEGELVAVRWPEYAQAVVGPAPSSESLVRFSGVSVDVTAEATQFGAVLALKASSTAYQPKSAVLGSKIGLIAAVQMRNNARVTFIGSVKMFDNSLAASNGQFLLRLARWTFAEAGVLRVKRWAHFTSDGAAAERQIKTPRHLDNNLPRSHFPDPEWGPNAQLYRIKDDVEYHVTLEVTDHDGKAKPYVANDVQVEFAMLDPYQRRTFQSDAKGNYVAKFKLPDQYGTFAFRVVYNRPGLSRVRLVDSVNVRPFRHDEYERFIPSAFPYYSAVGVVMVGFLIFSVSFAAAKKTHGKTE